MNPTLTIVVVAWNIAPYVREAIESCYQLPEDQCEILVIENASTDDTLDQIRAAIAGHPNARVICNGHNTGLGPARNQGMALARGDYVAFLDGDDWFAAGALTPILAETVRNDADLAVFDHVRFRKNGKYTLGRNRGHLTAPASDDAENRHAAAFAFHVVWNKFYRRAFLMEHGFAFSNTFYEDIDWTYPILMAAPKVLRIPSVGIVYRERAGSILNSLDPRHLEVITRMQSLADFMRRNPALADDWWSWFVIRRMMRQIVVILRFSHRLDWPHKVKLARLAAPIFRQLDPMNRYVARNQSGRIVYHLLRGGHAWLAAAAVQRLIEEPG